MPSWPNSGDAAMEFDKTAPKRQVSLAVNEELLRQAQNITSDLSGMVEQLLAAHIGAATSGSGDHEQQIAAHIAASDAFVARYGSLADEFHDL